METRLSSLSLQGYKTFARQTEFAFPARITAIVGPNGSGKSNVADAIRWVLGEQSYSLLRAKKTEDMIYSGSEQRSRSGMAEVSISFNNESGWLPIDYSEVVLTRRAYRDGQNEYLLNGQRVRLRDFNELLSKTGLSDRTYTIIGQGLVDQVLAIKADERRKLFEEAAGIGLYRMRKEEALRRLEMTERNLERASDIMTELKPRLRSLEKQAARVGEYKLVREDLQRNLRDWYGYHWLKGQESLARILRDLDHAKERSKETTAILSGNRNDLAALQTTIEEARQKYAALRDEAQLLESELNEKNQRLAILEERKSLAQASKTQLERDKGILEETVRSGEASLENADSEIQRLTKELTELNQAHNEARTKVDAGRKIQQELEEKRRSYQHQLMEAEKNLISLRSHEGDLRERLKDLKRSLENNQEQVLLLEEKSSELELKLHKMTEGQQELEKKKAEHEELWLQLISEDNELKQARHRNNQEKNRLNLELNQVRSRLDLLLQSQESLAGFSDGAKALMKSSRKQGKQAGLTDLATKLIVDERYEAAITAALREAIDILVFPGKALDTALIDESGVSNSDRVAVIAAGGIGNTSAKKNEREPAGSLGFAHDLVGITADLKPVVDALLSQYLVVEDADTAQRMRDAKLPWHLVTLKGELFLQNGVTILGRSKGGSKISFQRVHKALEQEIGSAKEALSKTDELEVLLEKQNEALEQSRQKVQLARQELQTQMEQARQMRAKVELERDKANSQLVLLQNMDRDTQSAILKAEEQNAKSSAKSEELLAEVKQLQDALDSIRQEQRKHDLEGLEQSYQYLQTEIKVVEQSLAHAKNNLANINKRQASDQEQLKELKARQTLNEENLQKVALEIDELRVVMGESTQQFAQLRAESLLPLTEQLTDMEHEMRTLTEMSNQIQQDLGNKERQVTHHQLELAREQEKMLGLKNRIEDDFGLIEMEYRQSYSADTPLPFPDMVIESLPEINELPEGIEAEIKAQKGQLRRIGIVNLEAENEYAEVKARYTSLMTQMEDLNAAIVDIHSLVKELDEIMHKDFLETYKAVCVEFSKMFQRLFNGGSARLVLSDENSPIEGGIEIEARLPGKREQGLVLLSGGERSLTAVALIFALLKISPTPICVLDEVDAMLDESNVGRFTELLRELAKETQFLVITHNRNTVQAADVIYGVTMGRDSTSQIMSLKLEEVDESYLQQDG